jgi:acyl carrier protein
MDGQVKVRGYRVEVGEIEEVLRGHEQVRESVVVQWQEQGSQQSRLVAYVMGKGTTVPSRSELRGYLEERLPDYMVPSDYVPVKQWPLTSNGKLDRQRLPAPSESEQEWERGEGQAGGARSVVEQVLVEIFEQVLGRQPVGIHDDFFEQGGHSLVAMQVIAQVRAILGVELPILSIFQARTVAKMGELVEQKLRSGNSSTMPALVPTSRSQNLPLSFAQQRIWFLDQIEPGSTAFSKAISLQISGELNVAALVYCLRTIVQRHEILRTTYHVVEKQPVQVIRPAENFFLPVIDLGVLSSGVCEEEMKALTDEKTQLPFDLTSDLMLRAMLLRLDTRKHVLLLITHHIASDAWSNGVFLREMTALYTAIVAGRPSPLQDLPVQYADYAFWQRQWFQGEVFEAQMRYWKQQLDGLSPLALPLDHPRPARRTFHGAQVDIELHKQLSNDLKELAREEGVTLFMLLLAAFQMLLARYTEGVDIAVGTPIANRMPTETEGLIGFFINTLVLRTDLSGNPTFREVLERVRRVALEAYTHQDMPFEKLVEVYSAQRDMSRAPLVQVVFVLQHVAEAFQSSIELGDIKLDVLKGDEEAARNDLVLGMFDTVEGLRGSLMYNTDLFEHSTIKKMSEYFTTILSSMATSPERRLFDIPPLNGMKNGKQFLADGLSEARRASSVGHLDSKPKSIALAPREDEVGTFSFE